MFQLKIARNVLAGRLALALGCTGSKNVRRIVTSRRHQGVVTVSSLIVLLVSLAGMAACGGRSSSTAAATPTAAGTPTATLEPQLQGYVDILTKYFTPLASDMTEDYDWRRDTFRSTPTPTIAMPALVAERSVEARMISEAQALQDHLTVPPPSQLQSDDTSLKQAAKQTVVAYTKPVALIDAQDVQGFFHTWDTEAVTNLAQYCSPLQDINGLLKSIRGSFTDTITYSVVACAS
jgi:hypothetical protein